MLFLNFAIITKYSIVLLNNETLQITTKLLKIAPQVCVPINLILTLVF